MSYVINRLNGPSQVLRVEVPVALTAWPQLWAELDVPVTPDVVLPDTVIFASIYHPPAWSTPWG